MPHTTDSLHKALHRKKKKKKKRDFNCPVVQDVRPIDVSQRGQEVLFKQALLVLSTNKTSL